MFWVPEFKRINKYSEVTESQSFLLSTGSQTKKASISLLNKFKNVLKTKQYDFFIIEKQMYNDIDQMATPLEMDNQSRGSSFLRSKGGPL